MKQMCNFVPYDAILNNKQEEYLETKIINCHLNYGFNFT